MITDQQTEILKQDQIFQWVAIKGVIIHEDKLLLGKRLDKSEHGLYELPGGKLEVGETLLEGLTREVREETGVEIDPVDVEEFAAIPLFVTLTDSKRVVMLNVLAYVKDLSGLKTETEELSEIRFYNRDEVKKILEEKTCRPSAQSALEWFLGTGVTQ